MVAEISIEAARMLTGLPFFSFWFGRVRYACGHELCCISSSQEEVEKWNHLVMWLPCEKHR